MSPAPTASIASRTPATLWLERLPVSTVRNVDRQLMEAGLRTKKGRGRGSALMSPSDAATLLIALAASDQLSSVQACVSQTRSLPIFRSPDRGLRTVTHENDFNALVALIGSKQDNFVTFGSRCHYNSAYGVFWLDDRERSRTLHARSRSQAQCCGSRKAHFRNRNWQTGQPICQKNN